MVDRDQVELLDAAAASPHGLCSPALADQDVAGVAVGVEEAEVEDPNAVHGGPGQGARPVLAAVVRVVHKLLGGFGGGGRRSGFLGQAGRRAAAAASAAAGRLTWSDASFQGACPACCCCCCCCLND